MDAPNADTAKTATDANAPSHGHESDDIFWAAARKIGVTRLAPVTGLDRPGIPVAAAYRPNSRSVCVNHGKGLTSELAKASALGEAIELHHAEMSAACAYRATVGRVRRAGRAAPLERLPRRVGRDIDDGATLAWLDGVRVGDGSPVAVPAACVSMDLTRSDLPGADTFIASTTGLGTGRTADAALLHALCETIERDAHALWLLRGHQLADLRPVRPGQGPLDRIEDLAGRLLDARLTLRLAEITSDVRVPAFIAAIIDRQDRAPTGTPFALGTGCHPDAETAIVKAVTEAAQMRLLQITAVRDDLTASDYGDHNSAVWHTASAAVESNAEAFDRWPDRTAPVPTDRLNTVFDALSRADIDPPILVDLGDPSIGLPVYKVLVPGLEDGLDLATTRLGERGLRARLEGP